MGWDKEDVCSKAFLMQSAMEKSCYVVGLCCVSRVFGLTVSLSATLQSHNFDLAQCIQHVDRVFNEAKTMRNDALSGFSSLFPRFKKWRPPSFARFEHHIIVVDQPIGIHMENRNRRHIIDCSLISIYLSFSIDFSNIAAYCSASAPCYSTAL